MDETARRIGQAVAAFIEDEASAGFETLALGVFRYQYGRNAPYRRFCEMHGATPERVTSWREIPAVPAAAFKEVVLACAAAEAIYRTSGTTRGPEARGAHHVCDPALYRLSLTQGFRRFVLPDREKMRILALIPSPEEQPDSSLSAMADTVLRVFGDAESATFVAERRVLLGALFSTLRRAENDGIPVLLLGTTLALVSVLESATDAGEAFTLPRGSRLMDTGGAKGMAREFEDREILARYEKIFGIPAEACVNEYGMTELLSQLYNDDLVRLASRGWRDYAGADGVDRRLKRAPHWLRSRVVDPESLADAERGLICHYDLANCHSVVAVLTEDLGERRGEAIALVGRAQGAPSRGCSIAMDEWLR